MKPERFLFERAVFESAQHGRIALLPALKTDNRLVVRAPSAFGAITLQEVHDENYILWHCDFTVPEDMDVTVLLDDAYLGLFIVMGEKVELVMTDTGLVINHREDHCSLLYLPVIRCVVKFRRNIPYRLAGVLFDPLYLEPHRKAFPGLDAFLQHVPNRTEAVSRQMRITPSSEMERIIADLGREHDNEQGKLFRQNRIADLLWLALDAHEQTLSKIKLTDAETERLVALRSYLLENLHKPLTLHDLCAQSGLNRLKLTYGFKKTFDMQVFRYILEERMNLARRLLAEDRLSVQEIALHAGYRSVPSFCKAIRKKFNCAPSALRGRPVSNSP